jgi:cytochrome c oxidase subunit III
VADHAIPAVAVPPATAHAFPHQFDDAGQAHEASALGMWVFLVTEILFFGGVFTVYVVYRTAFPTAFAHGSNHLDLVLGAVNTAVLIGSSLTMALAVHAARLGSRRAQLLCLTLTILLGGAFLTIKGFEYAHKFHAGLVPGAHFRWDGPDAGHVEMFYCLYFAMTGLHALHMVIGVGVLLVLLLMARRGRFDGSYYTPVELTGLYWHFVDIVWIFLFPLLYLIGRHTVGG